MHVLQWVAVEADSKEDALQTAKIQLESIMGEEGSGATWYDWFIAGGGRWNPNEGSQYDDNDYSMVMEYDENKKAFREKIDYCLENRIREFNDYRSQFDKSEIDLNAKLDTYTGNMQYDFELYPLKKMIDMIQGEWDFNSYFFDLVNWSTNPKHIVSHLDNHDKQAASLKSKIYLVPIDYHF